VSATRVALPLASHEAEVFNIGGGDQIALRDALALIEELAGRPLQVRYAPIQSGDVRDTGADTSRARQRIGFAPAVSFGSGLRAEFDWIAQGIAAG
jgi:nucleoside-diphosphate-sugar epimerase